MKTLVVGFGNPMRSDDGVGPYVAQAIEDLRWPDTDVQIYQQLNIELIEGLLEYGRVMLVDASRGGSEVQVQEVDSASAHENISSHTFRPELLLALSEKVYGRGPRIYICSIRGENFDFGPEMSPVMKTRARQAISTIASILQEKNYA